MNLTEFRKEYRLAELRRRDLDANPILQFEKWLQDAVQANAPEPTAMSVATVDASGQPSLRTVLLKAVDERGFVFCTNYESRKGQEIAGNSNVALLFFWKELERQVSVRGLSRKIPEEESDFYFKARPVGSQLGAWVSQQSSVVENRSVLETKYDELEKKYSGQHIPLPPNWGGYVVAPVTIEFWQGGVNRLHDRFCYTKEKNSWLIERLAP
ncbi:MAG: pyridoxamine 5'-phosphate oxidase [Verrucomicrobiota bacterium]